MQATKDLVNEHRVIENALNALEQIAEHCTAAGALDAAAAAAALDFLRNFVEHCHHRKEEDLLFPAMEARGVERERGPLGVMVFEHNQGTAHLDGMAAAAAAAAAGEPEAVQEFTGHAHGYVQGLRMHIEKEDRRLFPLADKVLSGDEQHAILHRFQDVERTSIGADHYRNYIAVASALAARYGKAHPAAPVVAVPAGHQECGCAGH